MVFKFPFLKKPDNLIVKIFNNKINALKGAFFFLLLNINFINIIKAEYLAFLIINGIITKIVIIKNIKNLRKNKALKPNKIFNRFLLIITTPFIKVFTYLF